MDRDAPLHRPFATRPEFHAALHEALAEAAACGARELVFVDHDFADWPLGERAVVEALARWVGPHRTLRVVARSYDAIVRRHARWVEWRRSWSHVVDCRVALDDAAPDEWPSVLLAPGRVAVERTDLLRQRGALTREPSELVRLRDDLDAISQRSVPSFPATLLGL